jgi:hypothetical protein
MRCAGARAGTDPVAQAILNGGASGPVVVRIRQSLLLTKVVTRQMPPGNVKRPKRRSTRSAWIDKGLAVAAPVTVSG